MLGAEGQVDRKQLDKHNFATEHVMAAEKAKGRMPRSAPGVGLE